MTKNNNLKISDLKEFYNNLDVINTITDNKYPEIQCKTQCNRCCKFYGSPEVFDFEWENIKNYIDQNFSQSDIKRLKRKIEDGLYNLNNSTGKNDIVESFFECPFIYKNKCSIYESRPFICRIFGYSKVKEKMLTCTEELNRWDNTNPDLPEKENLQNKLTDIYDNDFQIKTILEWLMQSEFI